LKLANTIKYWWRSLEKYPRSAWAFSIVWLIFVCWLAFLWNLGSIGLIDETEPLFAEAARQMIVRGDWITPYFNEATRFDKPPLIYWLIAICYKLIGVNEWAVRLPSALAAIALTIFCFYTLRYFGFTTPVALERQQQTKKQRQLWLSAWLGAALTAFNVQTLAWSRQGVSDMLLSGCIGTALFCFFWGYVSQETRGERGRGGEGEIWGRGDRERGRGGEGEIWGRGDRERGRGGEGEKESKILVTGNWSLVTGHCSCWYLGFYVLSALAVLTKGPVGIVIPGLIIVSFLLYLGKLREVLREMGILLGGFIFLAICLPWYILVTLKNGDAFINSFFGYHNFERFTNVVNNHSAPWYFYFLIVLALFAPWSIYLPLAMHRLRFWQRSFWFKQPRYTHLGLFAFFWFIAIFIFFTISITKLPSYVLPLIPAAAILVTLIWSEELAGNLHRSQANNLSKIDYGLLISIGFNVILLFILAITSFLIPNFVGSDAAMKTLSELIQRSRIPLQGAILWGIAYMVCLFILKKKTQWRWIICVNLITFIAFFVFFINPVYALVDTTRQLPLRQISALIVRVRQPEERLMMIGFKKPSVTFYTQQPVGFFWTFDRPATRFLENLVATSPNTATILIVGQPKEIAGTGVPSFDYQVLGEKEPYQLIRVETRTALHYSLIKNSEK
jgi:4-amino-4-deoxy-L-arabinose transferase-like glycosyltransferase